MTTNGASYESVASKGKVPTITLNDAKNIIAAAEKRQLRLASQ
jgi:topoisomerase IA-like protein